MTILLRSTVSKNEIVQFDKRIKKLKQ